MTSLRHPLAAVLLCVAVVVLPSFPADMSADQVLTHARRLYAAKQYDSTVTVVRGYLKEHGKDPGTEHIVPLMMEALLRTGSETDLTYFDRLREIYLRKFPRSRFVPRVHYLDGIVRAKKKEYLEAVLSFSTALGSGTSGSLDSLAVANVKSVCKQDLAPADLSRLAVRPGLHPKVAEIVEYYEFSKLYDTGKVSKARKRAAAFKQEYPHSSYEGSAGELLARSMPERSRGRAARVGLLVPISGEHADIGRHVTEGIRLAVDHHNQRGGQRVDLVIRDTRGDVVETARQMEDLVRNQGVSVVIGPILSANAAVAAAMIMDEPDVVMVTPTATDDGIARLGSNIFQMNVTLGILGRRIACYAVENLNMREFAIIAPINEYGSTLTASFRKEVERLGAEIVAQERFDEGTSDFRLQMESLRKKLAVRLWKQRRREQGLEPDTSFLEEGEFVSFLSDSTISVDGLFLPAESEDVVMLAPQVSFHRIRTQLLGSNGWHTNATILGGKRYVDNAIFSSSFQVDTQSETWRAFEELYKKRFKRSPDHVAAPLGYDAANLVLATMADGGSKRLAERLSAVRECHGVAGTVTFDKEEGANCEAPILKISSKKFIRVQ